VADTDRDAQLAQIHADLDGVELALARLDASTYASCEVCGDPLGDDQLAADPVGRRCRAHAGV
jgi:RNA polymerase-binding transcription factor DksA